ncbi:hypothetical protein ANN_24502 [Periplaneta americana]|uniref:Uncharacterized protein n=1 Tax=Periplaneta americana TaxID=6978 RepID=A0ABQ8S3P1_PERAM|nr:hypothetical protein ANN_24502 [Periplaneta americana]
MRFHCIDEEKTHNFTNQLLHTYGFYGDASWNSGGGKTKVKHISGGIRLPQFKNPCTMLRSMSDRRHKHCQQRRCPHLFVFLEEPILPSARNSRSLGVPTYVKTDSNATTVFRGYISVAGVPEFCPAGVALHASKSIGMSLSHLNTLKCHRPGPQSRAYRLRYRGDYYEDTVLYYSGLKMAAPFKYFGEGSISEIEL